MRSRRLHAVLIALAAFVTLLPGRGYGQVMVVTERDLQFGLITPGVQTVVLAGDMMRSAQLRIEGRGRYQVSFILPQQLTRLGGGTVPLIWSATDGRLQIRTSVSTFDPRETFTFRINPSQDDAQINLGARAAPAPGQQAGVYTATIVLMVVHTGN